MDVFTYVVPAAKTKFDVFRLEREQLVTYSVLGDHIYVVEWRTTKSDSG